MVALTDDAIRNYKTKPQLVRNELPAIGADVFYEGAAVGDNASGYLRPLQAGDPFHGFVESKLDTTGLSNGDRDVRVNAVGTVELDVVGVTGVGDVGDSAYASDDGTFTKTSTSNSLIGTIVRHISGTKCEVYFEAIPFRSV